MSVLQIFKSEVESEPQSKIDSKIDSKEVSGEIKAKSNAGHVNDLQAFDQALDGKTGQDHDGEPMVKQHRTSAICQKASLSKLRAGNENSRFSFLHRLRWSIFSKGGDSKEFGKVQSVTITPLADIATTGSAAVSSASHARSLGRARVTSTRLSALKTYLDEPA